MKTFSLELAEAFQRGLRADFRAARNQQQLVEVENLRPSADGLQLVPEIVNPVQEEVTVAWPQPQLFRAQDKTFYIYNNRIYVVDEETWTADGFPIYAMPESWESAAIPELYTLQGAGPWHFADFGPSFVLTNGTDVLLLAFQDPTNNQHLQVGIVYGLSGSAVTSSCAFRGRAVYGLDLAKDLFVPAWEEFIENWMDSSDFDWLGSLNLGNPRIAMVAWSGVGSKMLWPFQPSTAIEGLLENGGWSAETLPLFFEWMRENDWGFAPLDAQGPILRVLPLESGVVVYGTNSVHFMATTVVGDSPTFGFKTLLGFGIAGRGAAFGDLNRHVFIDKSGYAWTIDSQLQIKRLGYREFFDPMLGTEIVISYDVREGDFYLANQNLCYVLTPTGLGKTSQRPTSLNEAEGGLVGFLGAQQSTAVSFKTGVLDFQNRDLKRVTLLEVGMQGMTETKFRVWYRRSADTDFFVTGWRVTTNYGSTVLLVTGVDFMIEFSGTADVAQVPKIDYLRVHWQQSGKRLIRGI